ncbi:MAG: aminotransferase class V-fold PLP-dependent enzyme, partial [Thermodesulfobacteriota bacterium]
KEAIKVNTRMVIITYASNVIGTINPVMEIGKECRERGVLFLVDAAQAAGIVPIDVKEERIDLMAASGHKGIFGPQGTGILCIGEGIDIRPLMEGGTAGGVEEEDQPLELPARLESGTLNTPGIGGLAEGIRFILKIGIHNRLKKEQELMKYLIEGFVKLDRVRIVGALDSDRVGLVSFIVEDMDPVEVGSILDRNYGIMVRAGLHCAYDAHKAIGTFPEGTVRVSPGYFNTIQDIETFLKAIEEIAGN